MAVPSAARAGAGRAPARALGAFDKSVAATKDAMMGDPSVAQQRAQKALAQAQALAKDAAVSPRDAVIARATAQWLLAETFIGLNAADKAQPVVAQAMADIARVAPSSKLRGDLLRSRATLAEIRGDMQSALRDYLAAHQIFRAAGQPRSEAIALQDIGSLYLEAGDFARVESYYSQSLDAYDKDPWLNLATYNNRGQAYREQRQFAKAAAEYRRALATARELESSLLEARILTNLADAQVEDNKLAAASANDHGGRQARPAWRGSRLAALRVRRARQDRSASGQ